MIRLSTTNNQMALKRRFSIEFQSTRFRSLTYQKPHGALTSLQYRVLITEILKQRSGHVTYSRWRALA
ncbi:hypothetical protein PsorP6_015584 [Peronosclerospora sorghi]|uniref:Uncharacterized protein n=1 Tax=Peronosclerospora sorghi TaxID=230839 RepID=A0ACC0WNM4_9STRA|nr:hypothetical protein PsorP6_015584 [Peronosclerospora sorghi]